MGEDRKGEAPQPCRMSNDHRLMHCSGTEDEATIKVASKKNPPAKAKAGAFKLKLKEKIPKLKEAGSQDANILEGAQSSLAPKAYSPSRCVKCTSSDCPRDRRQKNESERCQ